LGGGFFCGLIGAEWSVEMHTEGNILHLNARLQSLKAAATRTSSQDKRRSKWDGQADFCGNSKCGGNETQKSACPSHLLLLLSCDDVLVAAALRLCS
jgi:hypothetical protein